MTKYIVVSGGVISGIGKGVIASSTALLLKMYGLRVTSIKIDPYLNIDAGTLSPLDHGEVFVLDDGAEVDLDLGNYERFLDVTLTSHNNITTGKIYRDIIDRERRGDYAGKTVQVVPHVTGTIQDWIERVARVPVDLNSGIRSEKASAIPLCAAAPDVCIIELGGTVGDIESAPFVEAMRQFQFRVGTENFALIHVSLVPVVGSVGEQKTKPTQQSVVMLRSAGLSPDIIACRSSQPVSASVREKIAMFCHVAPGHVMCVHDCKSVYHVPLLLKQQGIIQLLEKRLGLAELLEERNRREGEILVKNVARALSNKWTQLTSRLEAIAANKSSCSASVAVVGKYTDLHDAYLSVKKALEHAALALSCKLEIIWIEAAELVDGGLAEAEAMTKEEKEETDSSVMAASPRQRMTATEIHADAWRRLRSANAVLVPGGFGVRGIEGKVLACRYARENKVPLLGLCLGMQVAVIEYARSKCGMPEAQSEEFNVGGDERNNVIVNMPEIPLDQLGGTMRLGARVTIIDDKKYNEPSIMKSLHGHVSEISERHRHRFEVNPDMVEKLEKCGLCFVGRDTTGRRMEIVELPASVHPYYVGTQYHPEYKTRPLKPSPPFLGLLLAATGQLETWKAQNLPTEKISKYDSELDMTAPLAAAMSTASSTATATTTTSNSNKL